MYPPTPYRRQSKTFLTIDQRHRRIQRGVGTGCLDPRPIEKEKIGFPKQYLCGSLKNQKTTNVRSQHSPRQRNVTQRFAGGPMVVSKLDPPLTPRMNVYQKSLETVFSIANCHHCGDKLQFKTVANDLIYVRRSC